MSKEFSEFGKRVHRLQIEKGINAGELAEKTGMIVQNISQVKRVKDPRPATIKALADALGVDVWDLIDE